MSTIPGVVYRLNGQYLRYSEYTSHTGMHRDFRWVDDLQLATVFVVRPPWRRGQDKDISEAEQLPAVETRTVSLIVERCT